MKGSEGREDRETRKAGEELYRQTDGNLPRFPMWDREKAVIPGSDAAANSKEALTLALPTFTCLGIEMLTVKGGGVVTDVFNALGLPLTVGGLVLDTFKAPFCLAYASEEAVRAGILKLTALLFKKSPKEEQTQRIFKSFLLRMQQTATILIALGLEDRDVLTTKLQSGDLAELVGLTLLHTAFVSRHTSSDCLLLAEKKELRLSDCPPDGVHLFNEISALKKLLNTAFELADINPRLSFDERNREEAIIALGWLKSIKAGKQINPAEMPETREDHVDIVNQIISKIEELKEIGLEVLPESPRSAVRNMPGF